METNNNLTKDEYLQIQKCNKMIDVMMWANGYRKPLFQNVVQQKYDTIMDEYEKCIKSRVILLRSRR